MKHWLIKKFEHVSISNFSDQAYGKMELDVARSDSKDFHQMIVIGNSKRQRMECPFAIKSTIKRVIEFRTWLVYQLYDPTATKTWCRKPWIEKRLINCSNVYRLFQNVRVCNYFKNKFDARIWGKCDYNTLQWTMVIFIEVLLLKQLNNSNLNLNLN